MCNSFEISLQTFIVSGIASVLLWTKKEYFASVFIFVLSLMQLSDALIWRNYNNPKINTLISKYIIPLILSIQMIALYVCYTKLTSTRELWYEMLSIFIIVVYSAWITLCQEPTFYMVRFRNRKLGEIQLLILHFIPYLEGISK
jgi:hypothetical protein